MSFELIKFFLGTSGTHHHADVMHVISEDLKSSEAIIERVGPDQVRIHIFPPEEFLRLESISPIENYRVSQSTDYFSSVDLVLPIPLRGSD